jgi:hypothetical protein
MVPDSDHSILETNCAAIHGAGGQGDILILADRFVPNNQIEKMNLWRPNSALLKSVFKHNHDLRFIWAAIQKDSVKCRCQFEFI